MSNDRFYSEAVPSALRKSRLDQKLKALAKWVVESPDELSASEIEALWAEEAEHRLDELEQGLVTESPAEDVLRRARAAQCNVRVSTQCDCGPGWGRVCYTG